MRCSSFYSVFCSLLTGIVFSLLTTTAGAHDGIRPPVWVPGYEVHTDVWSPQLGNPLCWGTFTSQGELRGDFCFPLGSADHSCGTTATISTGESFTVGGGFTIEGVGVNFRKTWTATEAFSHTADECETCTLEICYPNATLRRFSGTIFCADVFSAILGNYEIQHSYTIFTPGGRPFVHPKCRSTPELCGCANPPPPLNPPPPPPLNPPPPPPLNPPGPVVEEPHFIEPDFIPEGPDGGGAGVDPGQRNRDPLLIIDLANSFNVSVAGVPVGEDHLFHNPGYLELFTQAQLVWLQYFIEQGIDSEGYTVAIRDIDGTTRQVDLNETPLASEYLDDCDEDQIPDLLAIELGIVEDLDGNGTPDSCDAPPRTTAFFLRGDPNGDLTIDISDSMGIFSWLFTGGTEPPCLEAADANSSRDVDLSDGVYILQWLFTSGSDPLAPFPDCAQAEAPIGCDRPTCP